MTTTQFFRPRFDIRAAHRGPPGSYRVTLRRRGATLARGLETHKTVTFDHQEQTDAPAPDPCAIVDTIRRLLAADSPSGARLRAFFTLAEVVVLESLEVAQVAEEDPK